MIEQTSPLGSISENELTTAAQFQKLFDPRGKVVLEIGGSLPAEVVSRMGVAQWISVDPRNRKGQGENYLMIEGTGSKTGLAQESVDLVFSCNAFEHIQDLPETLTEIYRVVKKGGSIYSHFGPIWSGPDGHHMDIEFEGVKYNFWEHQIIPHWYHLAFAEDELRNVLQTMLSKSLAADAVGHIYRSNWINRFHFEDYLAMFESSGLSVEYLSVCRQVDYNFALAKRVGSGDSHLPLTPDEVLRLLRKKFPAKYKDFFCRDIEVILRKFSF